MLKIAIVLIILLSSALNAAEKIEMNSKKFIDNLVNLTVTKNYIEVINKVKDHYNKNISDEKYLSKLFTKYKINPGTIHLPKKLESAKIQNNKLVISELKLEFSFENYLNKTYLVDGKTIDIKCSKMNECAVDLIKKITNKTASNELLFKFSLFPAAHAAPNEFSIFQNTNSSDFRLFATLLSIDDSLESVTSLLRWDNMENSHRIAKENFESMLNSVNQMEKECSNWREYKTDTHIYSKMYQLIKHYSEYNMTDSYDKNSNFSEQLEDKIGEEPLSFVKENNRFFNSNRKWKNILTCKNAEGLNEILQHINKDNAESYISGVKDNTHGRGVGLDVNRTLNKVETSDLYCKSMESLASCLDEYYQQMAQDYKNGITNSRDEYEEIFENNKHNPINIPSVLKN